MRPRKELETNVGLKIEFGERTDSFRVSVAEKCTSSSYQHAPPKGFELAVSRPEVIMHEENEVTMEPLETAYIEVPDEHVGGVIKKSSVVARNHAEYGSENGITRLTYDIPTRRTLGFPQ